MGAAGAARGVAAGRTAAGRGDSGSASLRARSSLTAAMVGLAGAGGTPGAEDAEGSSKGPEGDPGLLPSPEQDAASMAAVMAAVYAGSSPTAVTFVGWTRHSESGGVGGWRALAFRTADEQLAVHVVFWGAPSEATLPDLGAPCLQIRKFANRRNAIHMFGARTFDVTDAAPKKLWLLCGSKAAQHAGCSVHAWEQ